MSQEIDGLPRPATLSPKVAVRGLRCRLPGRLVARLWVWAFVGLVATPARATVHCEEVCTPTTECDQPCGFPGFAYNCGSFGVCCYDSCDAICTMSTPCWQSCRLGCGSGPMGTCGDVGVCNQGPINTSCYGYCGKRWGDYGCSCEQNCGFLGTCCPDVETHCGPIDGLQWPQIVHVPPRYVEANVKESQLPQRRELVVNEGGSAAGLTRVHFREIDTQGEHARCEIVSAKGSESWQYPYLWLEAQADCEGCNGDNKAGCEAVALRFPQSITLAGPAAVSAPVSYGPVTLHAVNADTGHSVADHVPLLTKIRLEDLDAEGEKGACDVFPNGQNWWVQARADDDANAWCGYQFLYLPGTGLSKVSSCPPDLEWEVKTDSPDCVGPNCYVHECFEWVGSGFALFRAEAHCPNDGNHTTRTSSVSMMSDANHACFLTRVQFEDIDTDKEPGECQIYSHSGKWWLLASARDDSDSACQAVCVKLPTPDPPTTAPDPGGWPPLPTHTERIEIPRIGGSGTVGAKLSLYQVGAYDRPVLFFEGFDPANVYSASHHLRAMAPLMRQVRNMGLDLWVVELDDGGQAVRESARLNAKAIDVAYRYGNWHLSGKKMAAVGVSMGALAGRVALASWEAGLYAAGSEGVPGIAGRPPVSIFVAVAGPHQGANMPLGLQKAVQELGGSYSLGEANAALNSPAARDMLYEYATGPCQPIPLTGLGRCSIDSATYCIPLPICEDGTFSVNDYGCPGTASLHDAFYGDVNRRNGTGFPRTVITAGLSNGSWQPQGCSRMDPSWDYPEDCNGSSAFGPGELFASARIRAEGYSYLGFINQCIAGFITSYDAYLTSRDLVPGDLTARSVGDISLLSLPTQVLLNIDQRFPLPFIPTESALNCPGQTSDAACLAWNQAHDGFDMVASNPGGWNGTHDSLHPVLGLQLLALLFDAHLADADGYCGVLNPYANQLRALGLECLRGPDCNDADPTVYPGAPEVCDGKDNNCDGRIDEGNPTVGASCATGRPGLCGPGHFSCASGAATCVSDAQPSPEVCDGMDNDCDGQIDEGLSRSCKTSLGKAGTQVCANGVWRTCTAVVPKDDAPAPTTPADAP